MIHNHPAPLPEDQVKRIREWIQQPAARDFISWIADRAAFKTAEAGNALVEGDLSSENDAKNLAEEAKIYVAVFEILTKVLNGHRLEVCRLTPKPLSEPT